MKHSEFKIGQTFQCGIDKWLCTDIGTRTISAICLDPGKTKDWFNGPPYAVPEVVFDENDIPSCDPIETKGEIK